VDRLNEVANFYDSIDDLLIKISDSSLKFNRTNEIDTSFIDEAYSFFNEYITERYYVNLDKDCVVKCTDVYERALRLAGYIGTLNVRLKARKLIKLKPLIEAVYTSNIKTLTSDLHNSYNQLIHFPWRKDPVYKCKKFINKLIRNRNQSLS
jgi:hypothetical protein